MRALVIGASGQDGTFLVRNLLARGHSVLGVARNIPERHQPSSSVSFKKIDIASRELLLAGVREFRPDAIFHFAAVHGAAGYDYESNLQQALAVNVGSVATILEYLRQEAKDCRFLYASSGKVFGSNPAEVVDDTTPRTSTCIYSTTKNAATDLIGYYRSKHRLFACAAHLFNHESELRPDWYFIPKVVSAVAAAKKEKHAQCALNSIDFYCDWGSASEYTDIAIDILSSSTPSDTIVATGTTWFARDLVDRLFSFFDLNYEHHINSPKPATVNAVPFTVSIKRLQQIAGRVPVKTILDVCRDILRAKHGIMQ